MHPSWLIRATKKHDDPCYADDRNFYKLEKWTKDGSKVDSLLYAGNNLDKARDLFAKLSNIDLRSG